MEVGVSEVSERAVEDIREELLLAAFDQIEVSTFHQTQIERYLHDEDVDTVQALSAVLLGLSGSGLIKVYSVSDTPDQGGHHKIARLDIEQVQTRCGFHGLKAFLDAPADQPDDLWVKLTDQGAAAIG
jgi:hypothetical protein